MPSALLASSPLEEERAARERQRHLEKMQRAAATSRARQWRARLREVLRETRTERCRCKLHAGMSAGELRAMGAGCTDPFYVCPRLDRVRRRMGA